MRLSGFHRFENSQIWTQKEKHAGTVPKVSNLKNKFHSIEFTGLQVNERAHMVDSTHGPTSWRYPTMCARSYRSIQEDGREGNIIFVLILA